MWATGVGLLIAVAMFLGAWGVAGFSSLLVLPTTVFEILFGLSLFSSLVPLFWISITCAGGKQKPMAMAMLQSVIEDRRLRFHMTGAFLLSLLGLLTLASHVLPSPFLFAIATVLLGAIFDLLSSTFFRIHYRRTPDGVCEWILDRMQRSLSEKKEKQLMDSFELIFPFLVESMKNGDVVSLRVLSQKAPAIVEVLLRAVGKLPLFSTRGETEATMLDRFTFAEAMTAKRLAWLVKSARESGSPTAIEETVRLYAKLFLTFHGHHSSLGQLLLISLCQQTQMAENKEINVEVIVALSEVVKSLIDRSIDTFTSEKESMLRTIKLLETYVKESFRRDKSASVALLMQPFAEIGQLLGGVRYDSLIDREDILTELRRILAQFAALETVTGRFESGVERTDTSATFTQDIPFILPKEKEEEPPR